MLRVVATYRQESADAWLRQRAPDRCVG